MRTLRRCSLRLHNRLGADLFDKGKPHIRNGCGTVEPALCFHLYDDMLQRLLFIFIQPELIQYEVVALRELRRCEPHRDPCLFCMVVDQVHDSVQAAVYRSAMILRVTEVLPSRLFLILCHMQCMLDQLSDTLIFRCGDRDDRDAEQLLHLIDEHGAAIVAHLIHHVQGEHHRHIELHQLHRQIQVSLNIRRIDDIDNALRVLI